MSDKYLIIDLGYFNFFRYFAAKSWYRRKDGNKDVDDETMSSDPIFQTTLLKRVEESISKIIKKLHISWDHIIFCRDCPQSQIWRMTNKSNYKGTRNNNLNVKTGFTLIRDKIQQLVEEKGCYLLQQDHLEADDLAYLARNYILSRVPQAQFTIITSDIDYYQICYPNTKILRLDNRDAMKHSQGDPQLDLLVKIIQGDKSDNILPIIPKCGAKTALKYAQNPQLLDKLLKDNKDAQDNFLHNKQLIDFSQIPIEYQTIVNTKLINEFPINEFPINESPINE